MGQASKSSSFEHIFKDAVDVVFTSTTTDFTATLTINPNDLSNTPSIDLAYGTYSWTISTNLSYDDGVENYAPFPADLLSPASGGTVSVSESGKISLSWSGEDPDGDALTYSIYMDQTDGLQEPIATNVSETSLEVDADKDSVYYWKVKSSDGENSAFSQIYAFRTGA
ncbi:hypothetical protein N9761_00650 [Flavobacteriaceae bacterium]|nr:hypothetical protein [Flavobacteriaceae bacterium]